MSFSRELQRAGAIAWKDLTAERRVRANFTSLTVLAVVMLMLFGFAFGPETEAVRTAAAAVLWLTVLLSGVLAFNRSYQLELESGAFDTLLLYPGARASIFAGKLAANLVFVLLVEVVMVPVAAVLYHLPLLEPLGGLIGVLLLGTFGFVTLGTFYAAMASRLRSREVLLPLLLFPMMVPLLVAAVGATSAMLVGDPMGDARAWITLMIAFDVVVLVATMLVVENVLEG
jgi:heme exporter protein B